ncbi:MAG TPA: hypothetical protein VE111_02835 [Bradyrhizobium sp.]|nr:hypothetical protein [Bradyrhizobium sp.]
MSASKKSKAIAKKPAAKKASTKKTEHASREAYQAIHQTQWRDAHRYERGGLQVSRDGRASDGLYGDFWWVAPVYSGQFSNDNDELALNDDPPF